MDGGARTGAESEPLVSVIMIFYNGDPFIAEAVESVLAQTYQNWELWLVDDGSEDRATAIAQDFAARFPERIFYREHAGHANRGMSASRNLGLKNARGSFVSYLDADDVWRPGKLTEQMELLQQNPRAAYVYGPLELWRSWTGRPDDRDELQQLGLVADRIVEPPELLQLFLREDKAIPSGILVRAEALQRVGGYDESFRDMNEDLVVHAKICLAEPVYASSKSWYRYRQHADSCNAQAWRAGRAGAAQHTFLTWLEKYLRARGATGDAVWQTVQDELAPFRPSLPRRTLATLQRQPARARRFARRIKQHALRPLRRAPVVLCYHRVFKPERDPHLLSVSPENFRAHLEVIRRLAQPLALDEIVGEVRPARGVVLTFDDGYLDNLEIALPILREFAVPATIYIATGSVGAEREFWWDDLERLTLSAAGLPEVLRLQINGRVREWDLADATASEASWNVLHEAKPSPRQKLFLDLHAALRPLPEARQEEVLQQLRAHSGTPRTARPQYRCVTAAELQTFAAEPLITLGAHTITHCDLDFRTETEQETEIAGSREQLAGFIGTTTAHFSYPYGSFNESAVAVCQRLGFRSTVTCLEGTVQRRTHPQRLPRFLVRDWAGAEFERQLSAWFRG